MLIKKQYLEYLLKFFEQIIQGFECVYCEVNQIDANLI